MTKEEILKDCEFDAAYKIWQLMGEPLVNHDYYRDFAEEGLLAWARAHFPVALEDLAGEFKKAVSDKFWIYDGNCVTATV